MSALPAPAELAALRATVNTYPSALLGYSGGVDSTLLAVVLRQQLGRDRMVAAIGRSASYPTAQWETARNLATRFDVPVIEIETHELADPNYLANSPNRCFYCKTELWSRLVPEARARGFAVVCDGTNAGDLHEHRPGRAAGLAAGIDGEPRWIPWREARSGDVTARLSDLGFSRVEIDPRGYRRGSLLGERAAGR